MGVGVGVGVGAVPIFAEAHFESIGVGLAVVVLVVAGSAFVAAGGLASDWGVPALTVTGAAAEGVFLGLAIDFLNLILATIVLREAVLLHRRRSSEVAQCRREQILNEEEPHAPTPTAQQVIVACLLRGCCVLVCVWSVVGLRLVCGWSVVGLRLVCG